MGWAQLQTRWRSLVGDCELAQPAPPFEVLTPRAPWAYAAISDVLPAVGMAYGLKVRVRAAGAAIGVALAKPNGSAFLSIEARVEPGQGETAVHLRLDPQYGSVVLLVRKLSEDDRVGRLEVIDVLAAPEAQLDETDRAALLGPSDDKPQLPAIPAGNIAYRDEWMWPVSIGNTAKPRCRSRGCCSSAANRIPPRRPSG